MSGEDQTHRHPELPSELHPERPEDRHSGPFAVWWVAGSTGGWISPLTVAGFTILWCLLIYFMIGNRARDWQYGVIPYIPGQSLVSSLIVPTGAAPRQVELPAPIARGMRGM